MLQTKKTAMTLRFATLGVLAALTTLPAFALPLLAESAGLSMPHGLTLYPDHKNPNLFYYMPNSSALNIERTTGLPVFSLTHWGFGTPDYQDGGGYLVFTAHLESSDTQKRGLETFLRRNPNASIALLPVTRSQIVMTIGAPLAQQLSLTPHAGTLESEFGVSVLLTELGARIFDSAASSSDVTQADYCMTTAGLGPEMNAEIVVNWKKVYDHFSTAFSAGNKYFKVDIQKASSTLRDKKAVSIKILGGTATDDDYVQSVADKIMERVFTPELPIDMTSARAGRPGGITPKTSFSMKQIHAEELRTETFNLQKQPATQRDFCVSIPVSNVSIHKDKLVRSIDGN